MAGLGVRQGGSVFVLFGCASLLAVVVGFPVLQAHGLPGRIGMLNGAAWALGAVAAAVLAAARRPPGPGWLIAIAAGLAATLLGAGSSGVHRWIALGPVRLNMAELLLAPAVIAFAAAPSRWTRWLFAVAAMILLILQPDASQAAALAGGLIAVVWISPGAVAGRAPVSLGLLGAAVVAVLRPDPLAPVPEVEGVISLAAAMSPLLAAVAVLAVALAVLSPLALWRASSSPVREAAAGLAVYLSLAALAPAMGAFPVPFVGLGVSPILGAWLGIGALVGLARSRIGQASPNVSTPAAAAG